MEAFENIKRELCEAPVLGMPIIEGMYVLDTAASVVAICTRIKNRMGELFYGSKGLSDTEMKYGAPKVEKIAAVTFVEKNSAVLGSALLKLRLENRVRLDGYHMIIKHKMCDKYQNADSLNKRTEFYEGSDHKQANQAGTKDEFSLSDTETYKAHPLTIWLGRTGHPIPGHPELPVEKAAEIRFLSKKDPVPLDLLLHSNLAQQELSLV